MRMTIPGNEPTVMADPKGLLYPAGGSRYRQQGGNRKIIGVQIGATLTVIDDASGGGETSGWTKNIDITSYSYGAVISLVNGTGATRTLSNVQLRGKPVTLLQGTEGIIHDGFVDHDSIYENGEKRTEWGNDWVVEKTQAEDIADYLWKDLKGGKHVYMLTLPGTRYNYEPGDWYWLQIGGVGQIEYLDSVVQVYQVETYRRAGALGSTQIMLREIEEAWKNDSTATARYIASGGTYQLPARISGIHIGSQYSTDKCDIYCDGTSDEDEINAAITLLSDNYGGGVVHLTRGTYKTDGAIVLKAGIILEGEGAATIIEKNADVHGITISSANKAQVRNLLVTRNAADTNSKYLIYTSSSDNISLSGLIADGSYYGGIYIDENCDNPLMENVKVLGWGTGGTYGIYIAGCESPLLNNVIIDGESGDVRMGLVITNCDKSIVNNLVIKNIAQTSGNNVNGFVLDQSRSVRITNTVIQNLSNNAAFVHGMQIDSDACQISGFEINTITQSATAANGYGLRITGDDSVISSYYVTACSGTGVLVTLNADKTMLSSGRSTGNTTANYSDFGTNTQIAAVDNT